MTEKSNGETQRASGVLEASMTRLERLVRLASAALIWEKLWRVLLPPLLIVGLFLAASFAGLWLELARVWRIAGVSLFVLAFAASLAPFLWLARPTRRQALSRIDEASGLPHKPASAFDDVLANSSDDPATQALWNLHRQRLVHKIVALRAGWPSPRMADFDRYALRAGVLVGLLASAFVAGPEKYARVISAFDWHDGALQSGGYRVDAWIDPPPYTGRPPILLKLGTAEATDGSRPQQIAAPTGSIVIVRASGGDLKLDTKGGLKAPKPNPEGTATKAGTKPSAVAAGPSPPALDDQEHRLVLRGDAELAIRHSGALLGIFELAAIPDKPPRIELTDAPRGNLRGSLTLSYKIEDDYGVTGAEATFRDPHIEGEKGRLRSLVEPPRVSLALPPGPGGLGETEATIDLSDHPWAGARAKMVLTARDDAGNKGDSVPIEITLPQKHFVKPLAQALAEQRRDLVLFPDNKDRVDTALKALMTAPEAFGTSAAVYLGLDVADKMLRDARSDADILATADFLWKMALQIENGDLSDAERALRAAEQKLREALQRGASDEEIRKLTQDLRAAMDKFLNELAAQQKRGRNAPEQYGHNGAKSISRKDLQAMLDRMQEMARAGDRADAQRMLEQLQNTLDNLAMARGQQGDPLRREMSRALNNLDKMMRDQQKLRDDTHRQGQKESQKSQGAEGQRGEQGQDQWDQGQQGQDQQGLAGSERGQRGSGEEAREKLRERQQALRDELGQLQKRLQRMGQAGKGLDDAGQAMNEAEQALRQGGRNGNGAAVEAQGRAIEGLRRGADQLAQAMQGQANGQGQGEEGSPEAQQDGGTDPLGRPLGGDPSFNPYSRYDPLGLPAAQRAQQVLEELRRRLADPNRPRGEIDYLERLLRRY